MTRHVADGKEEDRPFKLFAKAAFSKRGVVKFGQRFHPEVDRNNSELSH